MPGFLPQQKKISTLVIVYHCIFFYIDTLLENTLLCDVIGCSKILTKKVVAKGSEIFIDNNSCNDELPFIVREVSAQVNVYYVESNDLPILVAR